MLALRNPCSRTLLAGLARRHASTAHHDHHHHNDGGQDYTVSEGFGSPFWRNVVLVSLAGAALIKFAPEYSDDVYLTRWIAMYTRPREELLDINARHTALSQESSDQVQLLKDAKQPLVRRLRYPQIIGQHSPINGPLSMVDMSSAVVKSDRDDLIV